MTTERTTVAIQRYLDGFADLSAYASADPAMVFGVIGGAVQRRLNRARLLLAERLADLRPVATPPRADTSTP